MKKKKIRKQIIGKKKYKGLLLQSFTEANDIMNGNKKRGGKK